MSDHTAEPYDFKQFEAEFSPISDPVSTDRRREFSEVFRSLPWQGAPIDLRATVLYENPLMQFSVQPWVKRITSFSGTDVASTEEMSLELRIGEKEWSFFSLRPESTSPEARDVMIQFLDVLEEDTNFNPQAAWPLTAVRQFTICPGMSGGHMHTLSPIYLAKHTISVKHRCCTHGS